VYWPLFLVLLPKSDLADHLKQFSSGTQIIKELERLLIAA